MEGRKDGMKVRWNEGKKGKERKNCREAKHQGTPRKKLKMKAYGGGKNIKI